jgi:hypothetical protein
VSASVASSYGSAGTKRQILSTGTTFDAGWGANGLIGPFKGTPGTGLR